MKYLIALSVALATVASPALAHKHQRPYDPVHDTDRCYKQQFPACSGGSDGGGGF